jgi:hypothetical protein
MFFLLLGHAEPDFRPLISVVAPAMRLVIPSLSAQD